MRNERGADGDKLRNLIWGVTTANGASEGATKKAFKELKAACKGDKDKLKEIKASEQLCKGSSGSDDARKIAKKVIKRVEPILKRTPQPAGTSRKRLRGRASGLSQNQMVDERVILKHSISDWNKELDKLRSKDPMEYIKDLCERTR